MSPLLASSDWLVCCLANVMYAALSCDVVVSLHCYCATFGTKYAMFEPDPELDIYLKLLVENLVAYTFPAFCQC